MSTRKSTFMKKAWLIAAISFALAGTIACGKDYRSVAVEEVSGDVTAKGEKKDGSLNKGEHLNSGDFVTVAKLSALTMCADNNKYLYADENTSFAVENSSSKQNSNLKFVMSTGSTLHEITEKLEDGDSYEVDTPNSTMSVRGTKFRVTVYKGSDGMYYTLTEVDSGTVLVRLKTEDGTYTGVEKAFGAGESALIRGNEIISEFVPGNYRQETWILDYPHLPEESVERLIKLITEGALIPEDYPHDHVSGDWETVVEAGCEADGTRVRKCTLCGKEIESEAIAATGHKEGDWEVATEPACETDGAKVKKCEYCGKVMETETIKATGHKKSSEWTVVLEPACETDGRSAKLCEICQEEIETKTIKKTGHKYGKWKSLKDATCTDKGERMRVCETCGYEQKEATKALGHSFGDWNVTVSATCTSDGERNHKCSRCGLTEKETVAALGHDYSVGVTDVQPGCTTYGSGHNVCSRCGADQPNGVYEIARLGHNWETRGGTPDEINIYSYCPRCRGTTYVASPEPYQTEDIYYY